MGCSAESRARNQSSLAWAAHLAGRQSHSCHVRDADQVWVATLCAGAGRGLYPQAHSVSPDWNLVCFRVAD
jgi:hypothetical protein